MITDGSLRDKKMMSRCFIINIKSEPVHKLMADRADASIILKILLLQSYDISLKNKCFREKYF